MSPSSVSGYYDLLARSRLLSADELRDVLPRWQAKAGAGVEDLDAFCRWLVDNRFVTPYQADLIQRGHADRFFLGDFKLLERIGQGRMAGVYRATHRLGFPVAIKVLPPSKVKDPQAFGRFQREARLALKLDHPNIVRTLEASEDKGLHFIVMEHLEGETLEEVLKKRGKLPVDEAVALLHQALLGLGHINEQNMVHRDLKPANLMLVAGEKIKLLDVGLGRALFDEGSPNSDRPIERTAPGELLGSPDYMAPEQARDAHSADIRADIYSLGCILYHVLTGQPPFPDSNAVRKIVRHATEAVRPLKSFPIQLPAGLEVVLDKMLAKDPARRFASPELAAGALKPYFKKKAVPLAIPIAWPVPVAPPAAPTAPVTKITPVAVDSEQEIPEGFHLSRRQWILLATGVGGAALAAIAGMLLGLRLLRKRSDWRTVVVWTLVHTS